MGRVDHLSLDELHEQLDRTEGNVPTQRVLVDIGRKQGATLDELAERHNVAEKTIRNWLDRFVDRPLEAARYDDERAGRPPKLSDEAKAAFLADLKQSPEELGYDRHSWYPVLAHHHLEEEYGVEYSLRHVYRLLDEAGLTYRSARPQYYREDPEDETEFRDTVQKKLTCSRLDGRSSRSINPRNTSGRSIDGAGIWLDQIHVSRSGTRERK